MSDHMSTPYASLSHFQQKHSLTMCNTLDTREVPPRWAFFGRSWWHTADDTLATLNNVASKQPAVGPGMCWKGNGYYNWKHNKDSFVVMAQPQYDMKYFSAEFSTTDSESRTDSTTPHWYLVSAFYHIVLYRIPSPPLYYGERRCIMSVNVAIRFGLFEWWRAALRYFVARRARLSFLSQHTHWSQC